MITQIRKERFRRFKAQIPQMVGVGLVVVLVLGLIGGGQAQEAKEKGKEEVVEVKEISGKVVAFTPRAKPKFIAIEVEKENTDYYFIVDKEVKVVHKKNLSEIAIGDTVRVKYYVIIETTEEGKERSKRVAKVVRFVKPSRERLELKGLRSR
jgi:lysyl-tRNA synthetase class II